MKVNNSFNPSLNICCSNIIGSPNISCAIIQFISICPTDDLEIVHCAKLLEGYVNWIVNSISVFISSSIEPIILNSPSSEHSSPLIDSELNIIGSIDLFSSIE